MVNHCIQNPTVKIIDKINLNSMFRLTQYIQNINLTCNQNKRLLVKFLKILYLFHVLGFWLKMVGVCGSMQLRDIASYAPPKIYTVHTSIAFRLCWHNLTQDPSSFTWISRQPQKWSFCLMLAVDSCPLKNIKSSCFFFLSVRPCLFYASLFTLMFLSMSNSFFHPSSSCPSPWWAYTVPYVSLCSIRVSTHHQETSAAAIESVPTATMRMANFC